MYSFSKISENEKDVQPFVMPGLGSSGEFEAFDFAQAAEPEKEESPVKEEPKEAPVKEDSNSETDSGRKLESLLFEDLDSEEDKIPKYKKDRLAFLDIEHISSEEAEEINKEVSKENIKEETEEESDEEETEEEEEEEYIKNIGFDDFIKFHERPAFSDDPEIVDDSELIADKSHEVNEIIEMAHKKADEIVADANKKAEEILLENETKLKLLEEKTIDEARMQGFSAGYEEGMKKADYEVEMRINQALNEFKDHVSGFISGINEEKQSIYSRYVDSLADIAIATAEKITKITLESSATVIKNMIRDAVKDLEKTERIKIYISKYDFEMIQEAGEDITECLVDLSDDVRVIVMDDSELGTAIIETDEQVIDLSVSTQLDNVKDIIKNTV